MTPITERIVEEMVDRLADEFDPDAIILFGSFAWGEPDEGSDIDLLVIVSSSDVPSIQRIQRARKCLRGIHVPKDILVRTREEFDRFKQVPASLEYTIHRRGKALYDRPEN